jgi:hypothetical protein
MNVCVGSHKRCSRKSINKNIQKHPVYIFNFILSLLWKIKSQAGSLNWTACLFWPQKLSYIHSAPCSLLVSGRAAQWHKRAAQLREEAGRRFTAGKGLKSNKNHNIIEKHEMWRGNLYSSRAAADDKRKMCRLHTRILFSLAACVGFIHAHFIWAECVAL